MKTHLAGLRNSRKNNTRNNRDATCLRTTTTMGLKPERNKITHDVKHITRSRAMPIMAHKTAASVRTALRQSPQRRPQIIADTKVTRLVHMRPAPHRLRRPVAQKLRQASNTLAITCKQHLRLRKSALFALPCARAAHW